MPDPTKHFYFTGGGTLISDIKNLFSVFRTRKTKAFAYGLVFVFVAFSVFLAFSPSPNASSPWFMNIFAANSSTASRQFPSIFSFFIPNTSESNFARSFGNPIPSPSFSKGSPNLKNDSEVFSDKNGVLKSGNLSAIKGSLETSGSGKSEKVGGGKGLVSGNVTVKSASKLGSNQSVSFPGKSDPLKENNPAKKGVISGSPKVVVVDKTRNQNVTSRGKSGSSEKKNYGKQDKESPKNGVVSATPKVLEANQTRNRNATFQGKSGSSNSRTQGNGSSEKSVISGASKGSGANQTRNQHTTFPGKSDSSKEKSPGKSDKGASIGVSFMQGMEGLVKSLINCNLFDGNWVRDDSYPLYKPGSCSLIDEQFDCISNGRPDSGYQKLKWKPKGCTIPRMNGSHMLKLIRGKRLVFVGDSLNRNMWESLICILKNSVKDQSKVYEANGRVHFRGETSYSFIFKDFNATVEFFVSPFLVREWETSDKNGSKTETLRLDLLGRSCDMYKDADFIIFNTGHWWTHDKTSKGKDYYQEGSHVYGDLNVLEAFRKAMTTWGRWIDANVNPAKSMVFFRGYSASHFSGGQWNSGGACDSETEPIKNDAYLNPYPSKMLVLERVLRGMKTHVTYLNITRLTDYRKDGHPSLYRRRKVPDSEKQEPLKYQDCSHWCLPGVPDAWNEILYAELLIRQYQKQQQQKQKRP